MNIKEKIGKRIKDERIARGLTRKALAELTDDLNVSRVNNYERGERTPGPIEIKQLAKALAVSPAFLMCFSDDKEGALKNTSASLIPVLNNQQACNPIHYIEEIKKATYSEKIELIPLTPKLSKLVSEYAFALEVNDESMAPEFRGGDTLVIDPKKIAKPGDFVAALIKGDSEVIIRKYKELFSSKDKPEFELIALNEDWAKISVGLKLEAELIGKVMGLMRIVK